jgi:hypothetical protein
MNQAEWLECADPHTLLTEVGLGNGMRKVRLFACGCLRRLWTRLTDEKSRTQVEVAERFADGLATAPDLVAARAGVKVPGPFLAAAAWYAASDPIDLPVRAVNVLDNIKAGLRKPDRDVERAAQVELARDVFNLRGAPRLKPAWLNWQDGMVPKLAASVYESRRFDELPMLADALDEAGCDDRDLLDHLRGPGPHVPGCRVLDAILGKK